MLPPSDCSEQQKLQNRLNGLLFIYRDLLAALDDVSTHDEFEEAYERAEEVHLLFVRARFDLLIHIQQHGCAAMEALERKKAAGAS